MKIRILMLAGCLPALAACAYSTPAEFVYTGVSLAKHYQCSRLPPPETNSCYEDLRARHEQAETVAREEMERRNTDGLDDEESEFAKAMRKGDGQR